MNDYDSYIKEIKQAQSLEQIERIVWRFSAQAPATSTGGVLYSGKLTSGLEAQDVALALSEKTGASIINNTPRGQFLGTEAVEIAIKKSATQVFISQGLHPTIAEKAAGSFLYGDASLPPEHPRSIYNCLWCKSSREFVSSLHGDVYIVAKSASPDRVLGKVELPAALTNPNVTTVGGIPRELLQNIEKNAGTPHALLISQNVFLEVEKGITQDPHDRVQFSQQALSELGAKGAAGSAALTHPPVPRVGIPARTLAMTGLKAAGAATMVYDAATTIDKTQQLIRQGNNTGAQSEILHYAGRNLGMLDGAALGAEAGAALGVETGPGLLVTGAVGGVAGAFAGDWLAGKIDQHKIYNQHGSDGHDWHFDPKHPDQGWTRDVPYDGPTALRPFPLDDTHKSRPGHWPNIVPLDGVPLSNTHPIQADARLSNELNFKASSTAAELALAHAGPAQDPNNSPQAIAARYQTSYTQYGWQQYGPMPEAVSAALAPARQPTPAVAPPVHSAPAPQQHKSPEHSQHSGVQNQHPATAGLTPQSSHVEMFMAMMAAAANNDIEGMDAVGLVYAQSDARKQDDALRQAEWERDRISNPTYRDPEHPDHGLYRALREQMPNYLCDEKIGEVTLACRQHRFKTGDDIKAVYINGHDATIVGHHPALYAQIDLSPPAPRLEETMAQACAYDAQVQQQALERQQMQEMQQGRGMSR